MMIAYSVSTNHSCVPLSVLKYTDPHGGGIPISEMESSTEAMWKPIGVVVAARARQLTAKMSGRIQAGMRRHADPPSIFLVLFFFIYIMGSPLDFLPKDFPED